MGITIITDTKEQQPWTWDGHPDVDDVIVYKLKTGDYTVSGLENIICIERKKDVSELASNVTAARFTKELERMSKFKHAYLVLEFSIDDILLYPIGTRIPKSKWNKLRVNGKYILSFLTRAMMAFGIHVIFAGDRDNAILFATNALKHAYKKHGNKIEQN